MVIFKISNVSHMQFIVVNDNFLVRDSKRQKITVIVKELQENVTIFRMRLNIKGKFSFMTLFTISKMIYLKKIDVLIYIYNKY